MASGLDLLGWSRHDGSALDADDGIVLIRDTWQLLGDLGVFGALECRHPYPGDVPTSEGRAFARTMLGAR